MTRAAATLLALLVLLTGCGQSRAGAADGSTTIPVGTAEIPADAVIWAQGTTLHAGERQVEAPGDVDALAVGSGGIYFTAKGRLWFTDLEKVERTTTTGVLGLHTSKDGRYLGVMDFDHGPKDQFDTPRAAVLVLDTTTGKTVLRDETDMGDLKDDDLADLYEDAEPHVIGFDAENVYAQPAAGDGVLRYPLDGGTPESLGQDAQPVVDDPAGRAVGTTVRDGKVTVVDDVFGGRSQGRLSPSGRTVLVDDGNAFRPFDTASGQPVAIALDVPLLTLGAWTGPDTFYGVASTKDYEPTGIVTCDRDAGACTEVVPRSALGAGPILMPGGSQGGM